MIFERLCIAVAGLLLITGAAFADHKQQTTDTGSFNFVVLADTAYSIPKDYPAYYTLISTINHANPAFTIHLGDTKGGGTNCGDKAQKKILEDFGRFEGPLIYTPGDNEWTDCHRIVAGGYKPVERLKVIREWFFPNSDSLGRQPIKLRTQVDQGFPENALWWKAGVLFVTAHIVGSNNGLTDGYKKTESEYRRRNEANLRWIEQAFAEATLEKAEAVVLAYHANMFFETPRPDGFKDVRSLIGELGSKFAKPVLLLHGDHHSFIIDQPYGGAAANIIRLQSFGAPDIKAVSVRVDTAEDSVFSFGPIYDGKR
jgi:hypothetical protein